MIETVTRLSDLAKGRTARVIAFSHDEEVRNRLNNLGMAVGSLVEVLTGSDSHNYLVSVGNTRIGLEPRLAEAITVLAV